METHHRMVINKRDPRLLARFKLPDESRKPAKKTLSWERENTVRTLSKEWCVQKLALRRVFSLFQAGPIWLQQPEYHPQVRYFHPRPDRTHNPLTA